MFYVSGFDPKGPLFYHSLYRAEAAKQAAVTGTSILVENRSGTSSLAEQWRIRATFGECTVDTTYEFLRWDGIVRRHWARTEWRMFIDLLRTAWLYIGSGALLRVLLTAWPPFVTALYPAIFLCLLLGTALGVAIAATQALSTAGAPLLSAYAGGAVGMLGVIYLGRLIERRVNSYWLLRIYAFTAKQALGKVPELENRLDAFARHLVDYLQQADDDEVLIVGHSTGTLMAVSVLARALALDPALARHTPRISLLTLGECLPILSFLPQARAFRAELALVAQATAINWLDFTAPTDGACFALIDPLAVSQIPRPEGVEDHPKILSPRYPKILKPQTYAKIKRDRYRMHFQYLMAGELPGDYDYFAVTAGPLTLAERFQALPAVRGYSQFKLFP